VWIFRAGGYNGRDESTPKKEVQDADVDEVGTGCRDAGAGASSGAAADRDDALAILERAIKAHGGAEGLIKAQVCTRAELGTFVQDDKDVPFTSETTGRLPDRVRLKITVAKRLEMISVLNGDKGWLRTTGPAVEVVKERLAELREEAYGSYLTTLVPLRKAPFTLGTVPEIKVGGEPAVGIKVTSKGHSDSKLYFSKRSGLLVKIARRSTEAGVMVDKEYLFGGYKEFDGVKLATKERTTVNGKKSTEVMIHRYTFLKKVEDRVFERP